MSSKAIKIDEVLHGPIETAVETAVDEFGSKRYASKKDLVDEAIKTYLKSQGFWPNQE